MVNARLAADLLVRINSRLTSWNLKGGSRIERDEAG